MSHLETTHEFNDLCKEGFKEMKMREITCTPVLSAPPKRIKLESGTPVESLMSTALTFTFSPKTSQGYGIVGNLELTEF